jgi:hypothetical protein
MTRIRKRIQEFSVFQLGDELYECSISLRGAQIVRIGNLGCGSASPGDP